MERIQADAETQFTTKEFLEGLSVYVVQLALAAPNHQEIHEQVEVTCRTLRTITYSIVVRARVSDKYIHFSFMYKTDNIFPVLPIKHLVNQYGGPNNPQKLATSTKPSASNLRILFCLFVIQKATAYVYTKVLNVCHQSQKCFWGIFVGIPQHQKKYLISRSCQILRMYWRRLKMVASLGGYYGTEFQ